MSTLHELSCHASFILEETVHYTNLKNTEYKEIFV